MPDAPAQRDLVMLRHRNIYAHEHVETLRIEVLRLGDCKEAATVKYRSRLVVPSSKHSKKAEDEEGEITFDPGESVKEVAIRVVDDEIFGVHELRVLQLLDVSPRSAARLGALTTSQIYLLDDDTYPVNFTGRHASDPSDWQLFRGFMRERWWHRHPKPLIALLCRCYVAIDRVLETVLLSVVVIPRLQAFAARLDAEAVAAFAGGNSSSATADTADAAAREATIATIAVGGALVCSFIIRFLTSRKYLDVRGNSGTRKDLRNWLISKLVWWGEDVRGDASRWSQMEVFNATLNGVDEAVKKVWHAHYELSANVFDLGCQLALVFVLAGVSWPALLPLLLVPYLALVIWWNQSSFVTRVNRRRTCEDRWVAAFGDLLANWRMISCLDLRDDVASWFTRTYERFYVAHRAARFFEHDYKANLAFGGQLIASITLVLAAQLCLRGSMTVGTFVGLVSTMKRMTSSLPRIAAGLISLQRGLVALRVVSDLINVPLDVPITHGRRSKDGGSDQGGSDHCPPISFLSARSAIPRPGEKERDWQLGARSQLSHVQLVDVHFTYPSRGASQPQSNPSVLRGLSAALPLGGVMALNCKIHGGTSTLLKLIAHQLSPTSGHVAVPQHLKIVMVHEQPLLFKGTLWRNLAVASEYVGSEEPEEEEAWELARRLGLTDHLVGQRDLQLGDYGQVIGATDRTIVCIVRALLARPNLLLICKPFSTLDRSDSRERLLSCLTAWTAEPADGAQPGDGRGPSHRPGKCRHIVPAWMQQRTALVGVSRQSDIDAFSRVATFDQHAEGGLATCKLTRNDAVPNVTSTDAPAVPWAAPWARPPVVASADLSA